MRASVRVLAGIFEKFTEKAIKAVMRAQNFATRMHAKEVSFLHFVLLVTIFW